MQKLHVLSIGILVLVCVGVAVQPLMGAEGEPGLEEDLTRGDGSPTPTTSVVSPTPQPTPTPTQTPPKELPKPENPQSSVVENAEDDELNFESQTLPIGDKDDGNQRIRLFSPQMPPTRTVCTFDDIAGEYTASVEWDPYQPGSMSRLVSLPKGTYHVSCSAERLINPGKQEDLAWGPYIIALPKGKLTTLYPQYMQNELISNKLLFAVQFCKEPFNQEGKCTEPGRKKIPIIYGFKLTKPDFNQSIKLLASGAGSTSLRTGGRSMAGALASEKLIKDAAQVTAEVVVERFKSKGNRLLHNEIQEVVCDSLWIEGNKIVYDVRADESKEARLLPQTCSAVQSVNFNDLAGTGEYLQKAITQDIINAAITLSLDQLKLSSKTFEELPPEVQNLINHIAMLVIAEMAGENIDLQRELQAMLINLALAWQVESKKFLIMDRALSHTVYSPKWWQQFDENVTNLSRIELPEIKAMVKEKVNFKFKLNDLNKIRSNLYKRKNNKDVQKYLKEFTEEVSSFSVEITTFENLLKEIETKLKKNKTKNFDSLKIVEDIKKQIKNTQDLIQLSTSFLGCLNKTESNCDEPVFCEAKLAFATIADCHKLGSCDAQTIVQYVNEPWEYFDLRNCDDYFKYNRNDDAANLIDIVTKGINIAYPQEKTSRKDQLHAITALYFDLIELHLLKSCLTIDLPKGSLAGKAKINSAQTKKILALIRAIVDGAIDENMPEVTSNAGKLLLAFMKEKNPGKDSVALNKAMALSTALTSYMATYADAENLSPEMEKARQEARKKALEGLVDATTNRSNRTGDWIFSVGASVRASIGYVDYEKGWAVYKQPVGIPLGFGIDVTQPKDKPNKKCVWGGHLEIAPVDLLQFATFETKEESNEEKTTREPKVEDLISPSLTLGPSLYFPKSDFLIYLAPTVGYSRQFEEFKQNPITEDENGNNTEATYEKVTDGSFFYGLVFGGYIPLFDFN